MKALDRHHQSLVVPLEAYPYLQLQRGAISDFAAEPAIWLQYYSESLFSEFDCIEPYLPRKCSMILDVGSGLGGIDVLLNRHYGGNCAITLLDGVADRPHVDAHSETFNDMQIARRFLAANGVDRFDFIDANDAHLTQARSVDLIVSFRSWCFHFEPQIYLELVERCCISRHTRLIVDVRRSKPEWEIELRRVFSPVDLIYQGAKFSTLLMEAK